MRIKDYLLRNWLLDPVTKKKPCREQLILFLRSMLKKTFLAQLSIYLQEVVVVQMEVGVA